MEFDKALIPAATRRALRDLWEDLRDWFAAFAFGLRFMVRRTPLPRVLLYFGFAPGDDLLSTAVIRELRQRDAEPVLMISDHPDLFRGNPDPAYVRPLWPRYYRDGSTAAICRRFTRIWGGRFARLEYAPLIDEDRRAVLNRHMIAEMCSRAGITGPVSIRPYLALTEAEKASAAWARDKVVIHSSGMSARHPMRNKEWYPDRLQAVVDALADEVSFVQLGAATDPLIAHAQDLRGATGMRAAAAILHNARLFVGTVGFLMHVARAVECPGVIIFGGREAPWQSGYICNLNLYSAVHCAPCWQANTCDFDRQCMRNITADDVVSAIRDMLRRPRGPLAVETVTIDADGRPSNASRTARQGRDHAATVAEESPVSVRQTG